VHSDIKPDNILIKYNTKNKNFENIKIIDFGSSYEHNESMKVCEITPEYMPPEILEYFE
jgi:serine/threonine protein kinase